MMIWRSETARRRRRDGVGGTGEAGCSPVPASGMRFGGSAGRLGMVAVETGETTARPGASDLFR